ncbi:MAG: M14 family metallopeptidase [Planctomycetota bacterium]
MLPRCSRTLPRCLLVVLATALAANAPAGAQCEVEEGVQVVRVAITSDFDRATLHELERLGRDFEVWPETPDYPHFVEARVAPGARAALIASGLRYEVLVEDLRKHDEQLYAGGGDDFFSTIRTYTEQVEFLQNLAATYPQLARAFIIGYSVENRALWCLHITGRPGVKPAIAYNGAQHGNEKAASMILQYVAQNLLTRYGTDPYITGLVDHADWYLVPMSNPDGYVANRRTNSHNVDLNRNWDGPGSGQAPNGGPYPFSEPETQAIRDLLLAHSNIRVQLDLHGYTNKLMFPWGHKVEQCPDHALFMTINTVAQNKVAAAGGGTYSVGTIYSTLYWISGGAADYAYGVRGQWAQLWEVANSTMPNICYQFLDALLYLGEWVWSYDCNASGRPDAEDIATGHSSDFNHNNVPDECDRLGDLNCDGATDFDDINPFVLALTDPVAYGQLYPDCPLLRRDMNGDGRCDFDDINPFVALLSR